MREVIKSSNTPESVGSYSQAVKCDNLLFLSGQLCVNPKTSKIENESVASETKQIMENIKAIVIEAGSTMDDVIKCNAFLSDMKHLQNLKQYINRILAAHILPVLQWQVLAYTLT